MTNVRARRSSSLAILAAGIGFLGAGCGGAASGTAGAGVGAGATNASTTTKGGRGGGLDISSQAASRGALFVNDQPAAGEASVTGLVLVTPTTLHSANPPADTVVTLNGVALVKTVVGTTTYFEVDPAGPQPAVTDADPFLHITATSVSDDSTRTLNLACPPSFPVTLAPAPGSSLAGVSSVTMSWAAGSLPAQAIDPFRLASFNLLRPMASLLAVQGTGAVATTGSGVEIGDTAAGASFPIALTGAPGYAVELRYPGAYFIDGQTGGACGRALRFAYSK